MVKIILPFPNSGEEIKAMEWLLWPKRRGNTCIDNEIRLLFLR